MSGLFPLAASLLSEAQLIALGFTLAGVALLMLGIRFLGLYLASTHPSSPPSPSAAAPSQPVPALENDGRLVAVIAAATAVALKHPHHIFSISPVKPPSVESLMQQWSFEGRRAIYSSHRVR